MILFVHLQKLCRSSGDVLRCSCYFGRYKIPTIYLVMF